MMPRLFAALDKNMRKKVKQLSEEQFIEVFEASAEMVRVNDELAKKIIIRDMIINKIKNLGNSEKHKEIEGEVLDYIPKLASALAITMSDGKFQK